MKARFTIKQIIKQSAPVLIGVTLFSVITGRNLENSAELVTHHVPVLLVALPAFINIAGDLADVFCSRLSSELYRGNLDSNFRPLRLFLADLIGVLLVGITSFIFVAIFANIITDIIFGKIVSYLYLILIMVTAGVTATFVMMLVGAFLSRWAYLKGLDPDSIIAPITTTGGDMVGTTLLLFLASWILI